MSRLLPFLAAILFVLAPAHAQYRITADSIAVEKTFCPSQLIAPGVLTGSGILIHCFAHESWDYAVNDAFSRWRGTSGRNRVR